MSRLDMDAHLGGCSKGYRLGTRSISVAKERQFARSNNDGLPRRPQVCHPQPKFRIPSNQFTGQVRGHSGSGACLHCFFLRPRETPTIGVAGPSSFGQCLDGGDFSLAELLAKPSIKHIRVPIQPSPTCDGGGAEISLPHAPAHF